MPSFYVKIESTINEYANGILKKVSQKTIKDLRKLNQSEHLTLGSNLKNVWEEICVQVQGDYFVDWYLRRDLITQYAQEHFEALTNQEKELFEIFAALQANEQALFNLLENDNFDDYYQEPLPFFIIEIIRIANDYQNPQIRKYLETFDYL